MNKLLTPFYVTGKVVKGFGRGSKQLGIPTANIDTDVVQNIDLENGIYYGFCQLLDPKQHSNGLTHQNGVTDKVFDKTDQSVGSKTGDRSPIYAMVCSLGWNPQFNNSVRSLEVHILNQFKDDFYGSSLFVAICGYIRPEQKFDSLDQLIDTIHKDIEIAKNELKDRKLWSHVIESDFFKQ